MSSVILSIDLIHLTGNSLFLARPPRTLREREGGGGHRRVYPIASLFFFSLGGGGLWPVVVGWPARGLTGVKLLAGWRVHTGPGSGKGGGGGDSFRGG